MPLIFTHTSWVPAALCTLLLYFYEGQQSRSSLAQRHEKERERQGKRGGREGGREWARSQLWRTFSYIQGNNTIWPAGLQHEGVMVICHSVVYAYTSRLTACSSKSPPRLYFPDTTALLCNVKSPRSHVGIRSDSQVNVRWFKANTNTDQICKITWQNQWKLMKETKGKPFLKKKKKKAFDLCVLLINVTTRSEEMRNHFSLFDWEVKCRKEIYFVPAADWAKGEEKIGWAVMLKDKEEKLKQADTKESFVFITHRETFKTVSPPGTVLVKSTKSHEACQFSASPPSIFPPSFQVSHNS